MRCLLSAKEIGEFYETNWRDMPEFGEYLLAVVEKQFGYPQILDAIRWFHATRVRPGTTFAEGIFPLDAALPRIKAMLVDAVEESDVKQRLAAVLATDRVGDSLYSMKTGDSSHWGPYAMLVRDVMFYPGDVGQHDYLGMPEIIEDICNGFEKSAGVSLAQTFERALRPAIVKFTSEPNHEESCIAAAICYVFSTIHRGRPTSSCLWCFDGEGVQVPPENIISVEFVDFPGTGQ
ncbi:hypothetical protein [Herbaspirillum sp.]|uniref:hypothetical protein n=1 Tax=Herbaspirillum sp. TaxID=1890675 RepID=UPI0031DE99F6